MADAAIDSYQYPAAHLGHLSDSQQEALDKFKALCQERGYLHPAGKNGRKYPSHDDETLLRYLRARSFDVEGGFQQFKDTEEWRKQNHLEEYYDKIDISDYEATRRLYPQWTGRRDRRGIPVYVFEVAPLDSKTISNYEKTLKNDKSPPINANSNVPPKMLRLFALYENLTRFVLPLCTSIKDRPNPETPVSQSSNIVDISKVGLRQFWNLKAHMQDASQLATAYYPETLDRIFIIGAPSFFPTVWSWIKRWFDPITVSKIFILSSSDMKSTLAQYIDPANIPVQYGGTLEYKFGQLPVLEPAIADTLKWTDAAPASGSRSFPIGPVKWRESNTNPEFLEAIAVGSEDGKRREHVIAQVSNADLADLHGISRLPVKNTPVLERVPTSTGTATQPAVEGDPNYGAELAENGGSGTDTPVGAVAGTLPSQSSQPSGVATNTLNPEASAPTSGNIDSPLPYRSKDDASPLHAASAAQPRVGTSSTAAAQQAGTHAANPQLDDNTPHTVDLGHGDKAAVMEPSTVGQARKDLGVNFPTEATGDGYDKGVEDAKDKEAAQQGTGYLAAATGALGAAAGAVAGGVSSVTNAVGLTSETKTEEKKEEKSESAPAVPQGELPSDRSVEEYLRAQNAPSGAGKK